jgi:hypothetical protein
MTPWQDAKQLLHFESVSLCCPILSGHLPSRHLQAVSSAVVSSIKPVMTPFQMILLNVNGMNGIHIYR